MLTKEFMDLVLPYKDKLFRYALRIIGNSFEAEDIVQEVFIKVWKKKDQFLGITNKEAWCMTMTRNLAIDKKRAKRVQTSDIDSFFHIADKGARPDAATESNDTVKLIKSIIGQLPDKQKNILHLRDVEGYTYQEISDITGYKVAQVKVYLHRARITLRGKLKHLRK